MSTSFYLGKDRPYECTKVHILRVISFIFFTLTCSKRSSYPFAPISENLDKVKLHNAFVVNWLFIEYVCVQNAVTFSIMSSLDSPILALKLAECVSGWGSALNPINNSNYHTPSLISWDFRQRKDSP